MSRYLEAAERALRRFRAQESEHSDPKIVRFSPEEWQRLRGAAPAHLADLRRVKSLLGGEVIEFRLAGRGRR